MVVRGARAARDEVLSVAQQGRIAVTYCQEPSPSLDPPGTRMRRATLPKAFWQTAEIDDDYNGWTESRVCVAKGWRGEKISGLQVSRAEALKEWPIIDDRVAPSNSARPVGATAIDDTALLEKVRCRPEAVSIRKAIIDNIDVDMTAQQQDNIVCRKVNWTRENARFENRLRRCFDNIVSGLPHGYGVYPKPGQTAAPRKRRLSKAEASRAVDARTRAQATCEGLARREARNEPR